LERPHENTFQVPIAKKNPFSKDPPTLILADFGGLELTT
jgi:hypothetical protein